MSNLSLRHIYKVYSNGCKAVSDFNMEIEDKEFIVFVGPSGCGKSTTLRMIAGLEEISAGELYINDELVNDMEPKDRDISMVFQNYALYPHMTVYDNMAFGLKLRHIPQEEIHKKVLWAAKVLKLTEYLDRKPRAMSGGQRQRVALGRAILRNPKVFLLDEPLSNLDAKLRTEMRAEITKLHQTLGTTFIYVTHDQVEAMTLGTRVVVMKLGYVQQIDTPQNLYNYPENKFVAGFIGTPQMNFFNVNLLRKENNVKLNFLDCDAKFDIDFNKLIKVKPSYLKGNKKVIAGVRCENISVDPEVIKKSKNVVKVKVSHFEELGSETLIYGDLNISKDGFEDSETKVIIKSPAKGNIKSGDIIDAAFDMSKAHFFDVDTEESIVPRLPKENVFDSDVKDNTITILGNKIKLPKAMEIKDTKDVEVIVPVDAINLKGNIEATIKDIETINKTNLIHLEIKDRTFFMVSDKKLKVGDKVKLGIDLKRVSIKKDDVELIKPLLAYNTFIGTYTNSINDKKATATICNYYQNIAKSQIDELNHKRNLEIGHLGLNNVLLKEYKNEFNKAKEDAKADLSLKLGTLELGKEGKVKVKQEYKEAINKAKLELDKKILEYNKIKSSNKDVETLKIKAEQINKNYDSQIEKINKVLQSRIDEFNLGYQNNNKIISEITLKNDSKAKVELDKLNKTYNVKLIELKNKLNKNKNKKEVNEIKNQIIKIKEELANKQNEIITDSKTFFININGHYVLSNNAITKKIVQALGIGIFNVNYRYELGLDSVSISTKGFKVKVEDILDYGDKIYLKVSSHNELFVVESNGKYKVGDIINIDFDLSNVHVFENRLDIRLY